MISACNFAQSFFSNSPGWWWSKADGPTAPRLWLRGRRRKSIPTIGIYFPLKISQAKKKKKKTSQADFLNRPHKQTTWVSTPHGHLLPSLASASHRKWRNEGWEHPGRLTAGTQKWRWMEDDFPFQWVIFRFQPLLFRVHSGLNSSYWG